MFSEDGNLVRINFSGCTVRSGNLTFFHLAVIADEDLCYIALDGTGFGDGFGADDAHVGIQHGLIVAGILKGQDVFTVGDGDSVVADGDDRLVGKQLHAAIPVLVLDGDGRNGTVLGIDEQSFAHAQLTAFCDADDR